MFDCRVHPLSFTSIQCVVTPKKDVFELSAVQQSVVHDTLPGASCVQFAWVMWYLISILLTIILCFSSCMNLTNSLWIYVVTSWALGMSWHVACGCINTRQFLKTPLPGSASACSTSVVYPFSTALTHLVIAGHKLSYSMQNHFMWKHIWPLGIRKHLVKGVTMLLFLVFSLHGFPNVLGYAVVILWYVHPLHLSQ